MALSSAARASVSSPSAWRASATTLQSAAFSRGSVKRPGGGERTGAALDDLVVPVLLVEREADLDHGFALGRQADLRRGLGLRRRGEHRFGRSGSPSSGSPRSSASSMSASQGRHRGAEQHGLGRGGLQRHDFIGGRGR
jgi:hypothetical protein